MKERPILFSGEMVRAILDGRKTQTRRVIKPQPSEGWHPEVGSYAPTCIDRHGEEYPGSEVYGASDEDEGRICPYGQPGDRLWVRETWAYGCAQDSGEKVAAYRADIKDGDEVPSDVVRGLRAAFRYNRWRPSIHMPRWASRLSLEIKDVRVERVQEISEEDAKAEGVTAVIGKKIHGWMPHILEYSILWDKINAKREFGWDVNPWVWVIEFQNERSEVLG